MALESAEIIPWGKSAKYRFSYVRAKYGRTGGKHLS